MGSENLRFRCILSIASVSEMASVVVSGSSGNCRRPHELGSAMQMGSESAREPQHSEGSALTCAGTRYPGTGIPILPTWMHTQALISSLRECARMNSFHFQISGEGSRAVASVFESLPETNEQFPVALSTIVLPARGREEGAFLLLVS
eukprot:2467864-Rhodomonas_salina.2